MADLAVLPKNRAETDGDARPSLPEFLRPTVEANLRPPLISRIAQGFSEILGTSAASTKSGKLSRPFFLEKQLQTNWCWASVGVALSKFFERPAVTQCQFVQRTRSPAGVNCCATPGNTQCNANEAMSNVFSKVPIARRSTQPDPPLELKDIRSEISANLPIVCTMFGGGTGHFVVMVGWAIVDGTEFVIFDDPAVGVRVQRSLQGFNTNYNGRRWAQTTRIAR